MLSYWLPLNGNLNNNGLSSLSPIPSTTLTYNDNGKIGKCFNSGSQYISLPLETAPNALSVCFWVKPNSPSAWTDIFSLGVNDNRMEVSTTTKYYWYCESSSTPLIGSGTGLFTLDNAVWNHICMTADGTTVKFYINGSLVKTVPQTNSFSTVFGSQLKINIGSRIAGNNMYKGYINDFRVYTDHCLSPLEVKQISQGLVCHYKLSGVGGENYFKNSYTGVSYTSTDNSTWYDVRMIINASFWTKDNHNNYTVSFDWEISKPLSETKSCNLHWGASPWYGLKALVIPANTTSGHYEYIGNNIPAKDFSTDNIFVRIGSTAGVESSWLAQNPGITFKLKNYKLEIGTKPTPWCPNPSDTLYSTLGYNDGIEYDCSGYGNNGTKVGDIAWTGDSARYSGSYRFDGESSIIKITSPSITNAILNNFTISFWVYSNDADNRSIYFGNYGFSSTSGCFNIEKTASNKLRVYWTGSPDITAFDIPNNEWCHIAITRSESTIATYKNGLLYNSSSYTLASLSSLNTYGIGRDNRTGVTALNGKLSDFRIYTTALTESGIKSLYNVSASIDKTGVLSAYELVEGE